MSRAGSPSAGTRVLAHAAPFPLDSGAVLPGLTVAYRTWGTLDEDGGNAVLVCHALTGSADVDLWWRDVLGPGRGLDPTRDFVVCSNVLGGCDGTTGPLSPRPDGAGAYGAEFPRVTPRDMVRAQAVLLDALGVARLRLVVGGSLGGMQALEWAATYPDRVEAFAAIAVGARHSPWCVAWSEAQRQALAADPRWRGGRYPADDPPVAGLAAARAVAMVSYRSPASFERRFGRERAPSGEFVVEAWLRRHGDRLVERFDANTYVGLTHAMDAHDLAQGRGPLARVLGGLDRPGLVVAIDSDVLYPPSEQVALTLGLPRARLARLASPHGHDAFLLEGRAVSELLSSFRSEVERPRGRVASGRTS